jgi:hypothetical protein
MLYRSARPQPDLDGAPARPAASSAMHASRGMQHFPIAEALMAALGLRLVGLLLGGLVGLGALTGVRPEAGQSSATTIRDRASGDVAIEHASTVLHRIEPDPGSGDAVVVFTLDRPSIVDVDVFDIGGRLMATLSRHMPLETGRHHLVWRAEPEAPPSPGLYFVRIHTDAGDWRQALVRVR